MRKMTTIAAASAVAMGMGTAHAVKPYVGAGFGFGYGETEDYFFDTTSKTTSDAEHSGVAFGARVGIAEIAGTGAFVEIGIGNWEWDATPTASGFLCASGCDGDAKYTSITGGYEWNLEKGRPWVGLTLGSVDFEVEGDRNLSSDMGGVSGGWRWEADGLIAGPRIDLLGIRHDVDEGIGDTALAIIGFEVQYRFGG